MASPTKKTETRRKQKAAARLKRRHVKMRRKAKETTAMLKKLKS